MNPESLPYFVFAVLGIMAFIIVRKLREGDL